MSEGVSVSPDTLRAKAAEITEIDEWLDSVSGGASAGKVAIRNQLIRDVDSADEGQTSVLSQVTNQITSFLSQQDESTKAGLYFGLTKALNDAFGEDADKFVTAQAEANKSETEQTTASVEDITARREVRKQKVQEFNALKGILEMFGMQDQIADIPDPKVLRGALPGQTRGPRKINLMTFYVDGVQVPADQNSLSGVASIIGGDTKAKDIRAALKDAGVNTADPDDFEVSVAGKTIKGVKSEVDAEDDETPEADVA